MNQNAYNFNFVLVKLTYIKHQVRADGVMSWQSLKLKEKERKRTEESERTEEEKSNYRIIVSGVRLCKTGM